MNCDPDNAVEARADMLLAFLRRGARTYRELRDAGFHGDSLREAAEVIEKMGRGRVAFGPYVELSGEHPCE